MQSLLGPCFTVIGIPSKVITLLLISSSVIALNVPTAHLNVVHCSSIRRMSYPIHSDLKSVISDIPKADIETR
jgi:hypothetical protein